MQAAVEGPHRTPGSPCQWRGMSVSRWRDSTDCLCSLEMECSAGCNTRIVGGRLGMLANTATLEVLGQCGTRM